MDRLEEFLRANDADLVASLLSFLKIPERGRVYLPSNTAIEYLAEYINIPLNEILQSPFFRRMLRYGMNSTKFPIGRDEEHRETIDGLSVLNSILIVNTYYKIIDGVLGKPGDIEKLKASYGPPQRNFNVDAWLLLPSDVFANLIISNNIRGQRLLALCNSNRQFSSRCSARNEELFKIILRNEFGMNNISNAREIYTKLTRNRIWIFGNFEHSKDGRLEDRLRPFYDISGVTQISSSDLDMVILDIEGQVWITKINGLKMLPGHRRVKKIACGAYHTAFLDAQGRVWTFGMGGNGRLGHGSTSNLDTPTVIDGFQGLKDVSCGYHHTAFLDAEGRIYTFGGNANGELGHDTRNELLVPTMIDGFRNLKQVSCGRDHTAFLDAEGSVWTFGHGNTIGHPFGITLLIPTKLRKFQNAKQIFCYGDRSIVLDAEGQVWTFGKVDQRMPKKIEGFRDIKEVSCSENSIAFIDIANKIWIQGDFHSNVKVNNQNGEQSYVKKSIKPVMLLQNSESNPPIEGVYHVSCGNGFIAFLM
jgi:alpha-tubulin suppressor-like RCC1 family protein